MNGFKIELPLQAEYLTTVRLMTGGLCAVNGFDMESMEDYKVCVTESLLILMRNGFKRASIQFKSNNGLVCEIIGQERSGETENSIEDEISYALLSALLKEVQFIKNEEGLLEGIIFEG